MSLVSLILLDYLIFLVALISFISLISLVSLIALVSLISSVSRMPLIFLGTLILLVYFPGISAIYPYNGFPDILWNPDFLGIPTILGILGILPIPDNFAIPGSLKKNTSLIALVLCDLNLLDHFLTYSLTRWILEMLHI